MDGIHDLGGMHGFGPVEIDRDYPPARERWEHITHVMNSQGIEQGIYNVDEFRHSVERMLPDHYLAASYYEKWLDAITRLYVEKGVTSYEELDQRTAPASAGEVKLGPPVPDPTLPSTAARTVAPNALRTPTRNPHYEVGDRVSTWTNRTAGHTRLPRYARGKGGVVHAVRGYHVFPDSNAHGRGEAPEWLYGVRFDGRELWGAGSDHAQAVYLDLFEPYLEPANLRPATD